MQYSMTHSAQQTCLHAAEMVVIEKESKFVRIFIITLVTGINQITPQSPKLVLKSLISNGTTSISYTRQITCSLEVIA